MKISISRNGVEIGEWSQDEVKSLYQAGQLVSTDFYWHEGMAEWKELRSLIKPTPPEPTAHLKSPAVAPKNILTTESGSRPRSGIGRLLFLALFMIAIIISFFLGMLFPGIANSDPLFLIAAGLYMAVIAALRLINIGYNTGTWIVLTAIGFLPLVGLIILGICFFKAPNSAKRKNA